MFNIKEKLALESLTDLNIPAQKDNVNKTFQGVLKLIRRNKNSDGSVSNLDSSSTNKVGSYKPKIYKKFKKPIIGILAVLILVFLASRMFSTGPDTPGQTKGDKDEGSRISTADAIDSVQIDREFTFPLKDGTGDEVSRIKYVVESAEVKDELVIQGKKATAVEGRVFLILNLKVTNEHNQGIEINTRDYVRLSRNGNKDEWLAPNIHNDPVEVQAISTKPTRVGISLDENDTELILRVGEIKGDKEEIPLDINLK